jgi:hypothetical protein
VDVDAATSCAAGTSGRNPGRFKYVLPTVAEEDEAVTPEPVADADESEASSAPNPLVDALGLIPHQRRPSEDRDADVSDAPGLAQAPEESDYL